MTGQFVKTRLHDGVAIVMFDNPPVNALSAPVRKALWDVFGVLGKQAGVKAIALVSGGNTFCAGADIREFGQTIDPPSFAALSDRIEATKVPVVVGIQGAALGGGAEIALACHYRIADEAALIGLPEVTLGIVPGGGGTQRLPRIVGAAKALDMMLGGRPVLATDAQKMGLIDGVVEGHMPSAALHFAKDLLAKGRGPRPTRNRRDGFDDPQSYLRVVAERRHALRLSRMNAPRRVVEAVEAAILLPFDAGIALETEALLDCIAHDQSRALRHMFQAERRISRDLLTKDAKGARTATEAGQGVIDRLRATLRVAVDHVASLGVAPARIDAALLQFGFGQAPFGGTDPGRPGRDTALIQRRCIAAMMAEGGRLVQKQMVARPSDIDALAVHGMGFPRFRGGPMKAAHLMGLVDLRSDMIRWAEESRIWAPPALMSEAIKYADGFEAVPDAALIPG